MCGTTPDPDFDTSCPPMSDLPLMKNGSTPISVREVPCALRRHIRDGVDRKILGSITEYGCQWSFIDWVENYRSPDPYIDEDELRMCPLIWCRKTFDSKESVISHVFECPRLSNAWYWCPYHKRPERYLECNKLCDTVPKIRIRNKEYKLHLADKFLNWICRKRFEKKSADFDEQTTLDGDNRLGYKEELSTGLDNQRFESPGSKPEPSWPNDSPTTTGWPDEKARYLSDLSGVARIGNDKIGLSELASHRSIVSPQYEMYDPSAPRHEMYDSSYPTEMPVSTSFHQRDWSELLDAVNGTSNRHTVGHRIHPTPAVDPCYSTAEQSSKGLLGSNRSGNMIPSMPWGTFKIDDVYGVPAPESMHTMANPNHHSYSDRNSCTIFVETDMSRESSDSSGVSTKSPRVETLISSSPRPRSLDLDAPLPAPPQRKSLNLNRPLPEIPRSNNTQSSLAETSFSHHSSVMNRSHRLSSRTSASYPDTNIEDVPTDMLPDGDWMVLDMCTGFHGLRDPPLMASCSTDINMTPAGHASSRDLASPDMSKSPRLRSVVAPNAHSPTLDSLASDVVSPSSPNLGLSSPFSHMLPTISPLDDRVFPDSKLLFPATGTQEDQDIEMVEHLEVAANDWILPSPSPSEPVIGGLKHTRSTSDASDLGLLSQRQGSHRAILLAPGPQWTHNIVDVHPSHDTYHFEELSAPSFDTQAYLSRMDLSGLAASAYSSGIDKSVESEAPPSMMESLIAQVATSIQSASSFAPPLRYASMDLNDMNESLETVRVETPVPNLFPVNKRSDDDTPHKPPLVGHSASHSPFSLLYPSEGRQDASLWSRRQMIIPPLNLSRSNISSSGDESGEANAKRRRSTAAPRSLTSSQVSRHDQSREGHSCSAEIPGTKSDVASAHERPPDLSSALGSPPSTNTASHCFDCCSLLVVHSMSMQRQVEELLESIRIVNDDWMQRLEPAPELLLRCHGQPPQALFRKAFLNLREVLCARFPQTFEDVFTFIRVAFAIAFLLHCQNDVYDLDAFYEDALQWQHVLSDQEEKRLFLKAMHCWYYLPERQSIPLHNRRRPTSFGGITSRESLYCGDRSDLLHSLKNSTPFRAYIDFLDGFEEAKTWERNAQFPAEALASYARSRSKNTEHMIKHITSPLLQERGIEALQRIVIDTELRIFYGLLLNTREVEVTLNTSGRLSSESSEVLERFHELVTSQCSKAMSSCASDGYSSSRCAQHTVEVVRVLESLKRQEGPDSTEVVISPNQPDLSSPAPWSSVSNRAMPFDFSPTSAMSRVSTDSSKRPDVSTGTSSLTAWSLSPFSPTSLAPETPTTSVVSCSSCSKVFKGTPQDAQSNLTRHYRESRRHNKNAGRKCPQPECVLKNPMRSDNLRQHLQNLHKMSLLEANVIIDEIKASARRVDNGGIARRRSHGE